MLQQLIPHGMKRCLASSDIGPAIFLRMPPDFTDLAGKIKADVCTAHRYDLGTVHDVTGTKHSTLVGAEGFEQDCSTLWSGGGQDVPSCKATAKQRCVNDDVFLYNWKIKDWSRINKSSLF